MYIYISMPHDYVKRRSVELCQNFLPVFAQPNPNCIAAVKGLGSELRPTRQIAFTATLLT